MDDDICACDMCCGDGCEHCLNTGLWIGNGMNDCEGCLLESGRRSGLGLPSKPPGCPECYLGIELDKMAAWFEKRAGEVAA